jgi:DNA invertase Pin-like site-specific DNA recombinase
MRAAIYARVSTTDQNCELQLRELQAYAERQGWSIVETYQDTMSGAIANRLDLNRLMVQKLDLAENTNIVRLVSECAMPEVTR